MAEIERFEDEFGPEKILQVYDPQSKMRGILVIDNIALGPGKGGLRMTPTVKIDEVFRLARTMTWKCSLAELPFGGAKSGIIADPKTISKEKKIELIKIFAIALRQLSPSEYIAAPDMNTGEEEMAAYAIANGSLRSCTGKPKHMCVRPNEECGIPHESGSTGYGVFHATKIAAELMDYGLKTLSVAIDGFGNVGSFTMMYLQNSGTKVVAVSDSLGCVYNPNGLDYSELKRVKAETGSVTNYQPSEVLKNTELFKLPVDVIIPASIPDVVNKENANRIEAKLVVEAANIPIAFDVEKTLHEKGVLVIPDIIANAGGVISSYAEFAGQNPQEMFDMIEARISRNVKSVLNKSKQEKISPREAALEIAKKRVVEAMAKKEKHFSDASRLLQK